MAILGILMQCDKGTIMLCLLVKLNNTMDILYLLIQQLRVQRYCHVRYADKAEKTVWSC